MVDDESRTVTFLYRLEEGVAEGSFGMHCAAMCGIPETVVARAHEAASQWEHTGRLLNEKALTRDREVVCIPLGVQSDVAALLREADSLDGGGAAAATSADADENGDAGILSERALRVMLKHIEAL